MFVTAGTEICNVCGGEGAKEQVGTVCCKLCRDFFCNATKWPRKHTCPGDGTCEIQPSGPSGNCRHCMLQKCLQLGMSAGDCSDLNNTVAEMPISTTVLYLVQSFIVKRVL